MVNSQEVEERCNEGGRHVDAFHGSQESILIGGLFTFLLVWTECLY